MKALATSRSVRVSVGAVLALAAALLAPSRAAATGCGPRGLFHPDAAAAAPRDNAPLPAPHQPKPCSGSHCSASPLPLPPPTTPPSPREGDAWGLPTLPPAVAAPAAEPLRFEGGRDRPIRQASSIYRPPR